MDGKDIVDEIGFDLPGEHVLGIVGESGCGKTSTAYALLGEASPGTRIAAGSVIVNGTDILGLGGHRLREVRGNLISYVPQDPTASLNPRHRVLEQVAEALLVHGTSKNEARAQAAEMFEYVGLPGDRDFLRRYPFELSGGQQQRVGIAMALVNRPAVVVLDEPTTGLDVTTQARILELLRRLASEHLTSFIYISHDLAALESLADSVIVMYAGRIAEVGSRDDIFRGPAHPYTKLLLRSIPELETRKPLVGIRGTAPAPGQRPEGCFFAPRCPLRTAECTAAQPPLLAIEARHRVRCVHAGEALATRPGRPDGDRAPGHGPPLLVVRDIAASYGSRRSRVEVLHEVSVDAHAGECVALVGESGSGKSTLGRCIAGLHRPDSGCIELEGVALPPVPAERSLDQRREVQIVFQNPHRSLNPRHTVRQILARPLLLLERAQGRSGLDASVRSLLERVRLPGNYAARYPAELSGGEKQRVAIARALAAEPKLIVCDEVTSALDVSIQAAIMSLLTDLRSDGLALLFITHNLALVNTAADRVVVLKEGSIVEAGVTREVIASPKAQYTRELLAAAPGLGFRPTNGASARAAPDRDRPRAGSR
jgi:peptide/nickel transport system ATP-binding protein